MKPSFVGAAALALAAGCPAYAGDAGGLEPGLHFAWSFGTAQTQMSPSLSLGLYPNDLGWRRMWVDLGAEEVARLDRPAVLDLQLGAANGLRLMSLPLTAEALGLNADGEDAGGARFMRPALIVLAAGAGAALVIGAAGDAAEDNNPAVNTPTPGGGGGDGGEDDGGGGVACIDGQCVVPCDSTGPVMTCDDDG